MLIDDEKIKNNNNNFNNNKVKVILNFLQNINLIIRFILFLLCFDSLIIFILQYFLNFYFTILIFILLHIILIHYIIVEYIFLFQTFIGTLTLKQQGNYHVHDLKINLENCIKLINKKLFISNNNNNIIESNDLIFITFEDLKEKKIIYEEMKNNFGLSYYQKIFYHNLTELLNIYENNNKIIGEIFNSSKQSSNPILNSLINSINKIIDNINTYLCYDYNWYTFKSLYNFFKNDTFCSVNFYKIIFNKTFKCKSEIFITKDNQKIDYTYINSSNYLNDPSLKLIPPNKKKILFFCNPNGMIYEFFGEMKLGFYLAHNIDLVLYNYRGYGNSTGFSNYKNIKDDIIELFDFITKKYIYYKVGVYGYSIGGIPSTYLASKRKLDILISDRNFADVKQIPKTFYCGSFLSKCYNLLCMGNSYTVGNYLNCYNKNCFKIILCDPNDSIVRNNASIKSEISKYILRNYSEENKNLNNKNISSLDIILEKKKIEFIDALIYLSKFNYDIENYNDIKIEPNNNMNLDINYNLKEIISNNINLFFTHLSNSSDDLKKIKYLKKNKIKKIFIEDFFNNFIVWGENFENIKENSNNYSNENIINNSIEFLSEILNNNEIIELNIELNILKKIQIVYDDLNIIKNKLKTINLNQIKVNKGNLIKLNCGHNGAILGESRIEYEKLFKLSGFLN